MSQPEPRNTDQSRAEPIVGIDLGTTNSLVAVAGYPPGPDGAAPRVITDEQGRALCPSAVRFEQSDEPVVGHDARERSIDFPLSTVLSVKRLMGRSLRDAGEDLKYLSYRVVEGANNTARIALPDDRIVSPQEVSALILQRLRRQASRSLGVEVHKAVITVPAYFDDAQRQATRDAARLAGLEAVRIVNEPTAAALAYGVGLGKQSEPQTVAVYDLGGGTFDVSILRLTPRSEADAADAFEVLATAGDTHLGGDDFDQALMQLFTDEINQRFAPEGPPITFPPEARRALRQFAEATRIRLSDEDTASVRIDLGEGRTYDRSITRAELESLIEPFVDRTVTACRRALRDARRALDGAPIDTVVLVGGATRTPLVRRKVAEFFNTEPYTALDPDRVVALGAALQASVLSGAARDTLLLDVVPLSLGIETAGGAVAKLIMRNTTVPAQATETFSTSVDGQTSIKINVLQGEREMAEDCRSLGLFHLTGLPPMPAGIPKLKVTFHVDANAVLTVSAVEERSGRRAGIQVVPNHGLTREEVQRIEAESFAHAKEDMMRHRVVDIAANAKLDLHWIRKQLDAHADALEPDYLDSLNRLAAKLESLVRDAEADWKRVDPDEFHNAKQELDNASVKLHEIAITRSLKQEQRAD